MTWKRPAALLLALGLAPGAARAGDAELLPELHLRLMAARYVPAEQDFQWVGWMGGSAGVLRIERLTLFGSADVETIIGNERRAFDANQANYHLGTAVKYGMGARELSIFFDHVSRHRQDREKPEAVDWNTLGVRFAGRFSPSSPVRFEVSIGHTTLASQVGYELEAVAALEADLVRRPRWALFLNGQARGVTAEPTPTFPRDGFVDVWIEAGLRFRRAERALQLFAAYEHRNDVYVEKPGVRDRALLGARFGFVADR